MSGGAAYGRAWLNLNPSQIPGSHGRIDEKRCAVELAMGWHNRIGETKPVLLGPEFVNVMLLLLDEFRLLYVDAYHAGLSGTEELGISTSEVRMVAHLAIRSGLLCVRPFSGYLVIISPANRYMYSPSRYSPVCTGYGCLL